ncbi:MAG: geranylgeranylglyceryl/heptaprenylglyceryl phosphate synthase [Bacteroidetes bacterium GWF2_38_335]|nr:MAG: geranylgeranylglyceryl/heptaprenylglyceryl phosphate synthase [Bacteroidetes bacterium GWF2_38_335]OFY78706.1 MAG: geranylgeranylglyceryl/heptaprenylglyceryl phosphate synthase [Bacteroidetes bacterium RIFOXYA12_FULL_38_20]HBS88466.1 geranylgeranylglyceryl/heptaprenylglyceryl phosphate synthase [Bacteroidales bacterium]
MKKKQEIFKQVMQGRKKKIAQLIDPGKTSLKSLEKTIQLSDKAGIDFFFVGGSLTSFSIDPVINTIKSISSTPVVLFPGNLLQLSDKADALLLLSMISGRNPEFLIGNHVVAAPFLKKSGIEIIPTGYILVENGKKTSVEYMSNTSPIPSGKCDIAAATALAGELLGLKMIYLEAGSGATNPVSDKMISEVKKNISVPLVVGGGIKNTEQIKAVLSSGADMVVVGTAFEENPNLIIDFCKTVHSF